MKRILSWLLALVLTVGLFPAGTMQVAAAEVAEATVPEQTTEPEHTHSYSAVVTEPTCQDQGYTTYTCTCGDSYEGDFTEALDHEFGPWYGEGQPACLQPGTERQDCIRCDAFRVRNVDPTGHRYVPYVSEPTYTTEGYTEYICACGDSYVDERSIVDSLPLPVPQLRLTDGVLDWTCREGVDGYEIWRATSKSGKYTKVGFTDSCCWEDTDYSVGKTYYYKVRSVCGDGGRFISDYSNIVSQAYVCAEPVLSGEYNDDTGKPVLTWEAVPGAKKYELYRSTSENSGYKKVTTTTKLTYTDTKAEVGTQYYYKVKAIASKKTYNSDFSQTVTCSPVCGTPVVTAKPDADTGKPILTWKAVPGAAYYLILRRLAGEESFTRIDKIQSLSYLDETAVLDTHYQYMVQALGREERLDGQPSVAVGVVCGLARPLLDTQINDAGKPVITWEAVEGAVAYRVYRSTSAKKSYILVTTTEDLFYLDESVAAGKTYYYKLEAVGQAGQSAQTDYVKLTGKCAIPELTVAAGTTGKPSLSWNKIAGAKKYEIWRSVDGATFKRLTTTTKITYTDSKAPNGSRCAYQVKALGSKSAYHSAFSQPDSCDVTCAAPTLTVKIDKATGKPSLSWKKVTGAKGYGIYRSENGGEYAYLTTVTALSFLDEATRADRQYSYYIKTAGKEAAFDSVASTAKTVTVTVGTAKPAGTVNAAGKVVIAWEAVEDAAAYQIYRSAKSSSGYKRLETVEALSYTDESVATGKTYYYKIVVVGHNSESAMSSYVKIAGACAQPQISSIGFNQDSGKPVITWDKVTGAKKYEVWRSTSRESGYQKLATVTKTTYTDTKAEVGTFYYYKICAVGSKTSYNSVLSNPRGCLTVCAKPVVSVKLNNDFQPSLSWKAVDGAAAYEVYRATRGGSFALLATVTEPGYVDGAVQIGDLYRYQVKAVAQSPLSNSGLSEQVLISIPCRAAEVDTAVGENGKPMLTWDAVEGGQGYRIYRSTKKTSGFKLQTETAKLNYTDRNATKGKTYYYYITVVAQDTESAKSNTVKIKCAK